MKTADAGMASFFLTIHKAQRLDGEGGPDDDEVRRMGVGLEKGVNNLHKIIVN